MWTCGTTAGFPGARVRLASPVLRTEPSCLQTNGHTHLARVRVAIGPSNGPERVRHPRAAVAGQGGIIGRSSRAIAVPVGRTVAREGPCLMAGVFGHLACTGDAGLTCLNARRRSATQFWRWTHASHATPAALRNDLYARVCGLPDATPHCARIGRSHLLARVPWCDAGVEATHGRCRAGLAFLRGGARCVRMAGRVRRTGRKCWCR